MAEAPSTQIIVNGYHGPDEPPDTLEKLLALLETHPVASWTTCRPLKQTPHATFLCGEFRTLRHPFSILSSDPAVVRRITEAFTANCDRFHVKSEEPRIRQARSPREKSRRKTRSR